MNWNAKPAPIERAAVIIAASSLGAAVAFALARLGLVAPLLAAGPGIAVAALGWLALARVDAAGAVGVGFTPLDFAEAIAAGDDDDVLLLDQPVEVGAAPPSRVVRLFGDEAAPDAAASAVPGPGEMLARIEDFLGVRSGAAGQGVARLPAVDSASAEASAALHAALADIRRSLAKG